MDRENYYAPPEETELHKKRSPAISTAGTIATRFPAALLDLALAGALAIFIVDNVEDSLFAEYDYVSFALPLIAYPLICFGYFFAFELPFARTPGKLLFGLKVVRFDGKRCTKWQIFVRNLTRLVEIHPMLLPAAICIFATKHRQRIGDLLAGTVVVPVHRIREAEESIDSKQPES